MANELCGHPTSKGPCNMPKGHKSKWHRHREYSTTVWVMKNSDNEQVAHGTGVNTLTSAITANCVNGRKLLIEVMCRR